MIPRSAVVAAGVVLGLAAATPGSAQDIGGRVAAVRDGTVEFTYAVRPDACGNWSERGERWCGRVVIERRGGATDDVRLHSFAWADSGTATVNLGRVSAAAAARYLLGQAEALTGHAASSALFGAAMADSVDVRPDLRRILADDRRPERLRRDAVLALSEQDPGADDARALEQVFPGASEKLREVILLVMSHSDLPGAAEWMEGVVQNGTYPREVRKKALFWLGQSRDPKAREFLRRMVTQ